MATAITFLACDEPYGELSNYYPAAIAIDGVTYPSVEVSEKKKKMKKMKSLFRTHTSNNSTTTMRQSSRTPRMRRPFELHLVGDAVIPSRDHIILLLFVVLAIW